MAWPKPEMIPSGVPSKPRQRIWVVLCCMFILLSFVIFALFWPDDRYVYQPIFWIMALCFGIALGGMVLCARFYVYGLALEQHEIWQQEQKSIQRNWQNWAMKRTAILGSYLLTPIELTAERILCDRRNLPSYVGRSLTFDPPLDPAIALEDLFYSFRPLLAKLPQDVPLIIDAYSSESAYVDLKVIVDHVFPHLQLEQEYTFSHQILTETHSEAIRALIETPPVGAHLILINNGASETFSFMSGLLLGDADRKMPEVSHNSISSILRPMISTDAQAAIRQMAELQPVITQAKGLWLGNFTKEKEMELMQFLSQSGISPDEVYLLNSMAGNQNFLSYWFALLLAGEVARETQTTQLVITGGARNEYIFSTLKNQYETL